MPNPLIEKLIDELSSTEKIHVTSEVIEALEDFQQREVRDPSFVQFQFQVNYEKSEYHCGFQLPKLEYEKLIDKLKSLCVGIGNEFYFAGPDATITVIEFTPESLDTADEVFQSFASEMEGLENDDFFTALGVSREALD